jgi:uncharacterized membrane protein
MTDLRFIGDLPLLPGLVLALAAGGLAWWLYWRETRALDTPARWLLPTLRAAAIVLVLLILTAPVLHHRYREGEPGRLVVLVDSSQSMAIHDRQLEPEAKLAIAQSLGWDADSGPSGVDAGPLQQRFDSSTRYSRAIERLLGGTHGLLPAVQDAFEVTVSRFDRDRSVLWESTLKKTSPLPASPEVWMPAAYGSSSRIGRALAGDGVRGAAGLVPSGMVPASGAEATPASDGGSAESPALEGAEQAPETVVLLTDGRNTHAPSPLEVAESLAAQRRQVYIIGLGSELAPEDVSLAGVEHPERIFERDMLRGTLVIRNRMRQSQPLQLSILHAGEVVWQETRSLAAEDNGRVDFSFPVEGIVKAIKERSGRDVEFASLPLHLEAVVEPQPGEAVEENNRRDFHVLVVTKRSRMLIVEGRSRWEVRYLRNMFERDPAWQVDSVLPDYAQQPPAAPRGEGESRWPVSRDKLLQYDLVVLGEMPAPALPSDAAAWLKSFVESSGGGLIVIDGSRGNLRDAAYEPLHGMLPVKWLRDNRLLPPPVSVQLTSAARALPAFQLTPNDPSALERTWAELPQLNFHTVVEALPGSEVLATVRSEGNDVPLLVTRQYGAGRVLYCGTDETWRWRYKVADTYHQRFWNQIARWVMRLPMSVQGQYVGIDSGKLVYAADEAIVIRSRLRDADGRPATDLAVEAVVSRLESSAGESSAGESATGAASAGAAPDSQPPSASTTRAAQASQASQAALVERVVAVVPLDAEASVAGVYTGQLVASEPGNYRVRIVAPGLTSAALDLHTEFTVAEGDVGEMDQLACDASLLRQLAQRTGGEYLPEARGHELAGLLQPLSRGRIVETDTLLWQSYWWFVPVVLLLCLEWWIRKRVGLL